MDSALAGQLRLLLIDRWKWLAGGALAAAVAMVAYLLLQQPVYTVSVYVVPQRARTEVNYDTRIRTVSADAPDQSGLGQTGLSMPTSERRLALAQLAQSVDIENAVREQLGDRLPESLRTPGALLRQVSGRVVPRSEMIVLEVRSSDPALADDVAERWAQVYEEQVNQLYGTSLAGTLKLDEELNQAKQKYEAAEGALTAFMAGTPLGEYARALEARQRLARELVAIQDAQQADLNKIAHRVGLLISQAEALQQQLAVAQDESAAATSAAALTLLKTQAFASSMSLPANLQLQITSPPPTGNQTPSDRAERQVSSVTTTPEERPHVEGTSRALQDWQLPSNVQVELPVPTTATSLAQQRADVASTLHALRAWQDRLRQEMQHGSTGASAGSTSGASVGQAISQLEAEVRDLQGKVAEQSARQRSLQQERDVLWESYVSIMKKAEEGRVASLVATGKEVSIAGRSAPEPRARRLELLTPLAAIAGAALVGAFFFLHRLLTTPPSNARPASSNGHLAPGTTPSPQKEEVAP
ncbi:MAG TPA: hypothetical protein VHJ78_03380 [Actinomycetota bacterium]|nr:hypothetical protein [Actinomycetota bacterium]